MKSGCTTLAMPAISDAKPGSAAVTSSKPVFINRSIEEINSTGNNMSPWHAKKQDSGYFN